MKVLYFLAAVFSFGVLIAIHEFGHFVAAKLCGVRVVEFSVGMGPLVFQKEKGDTLYSLRALPLGGFCAMEGEDEDTGCENSFIRQGFLRKLVILAAGSFMNFVMGILLIAVLFAGAISFNVDQVVGLAPEFRQTGENGLMEGDLVYKINGYRTYLAGDAQMFLGYSDNLVEIEVVRNGEHITVENIPLQMCTGLDGQPYMGYGIYIGKYAVPATLGTKIQYICYQAVDFVQQVWFSLCQLVRGTVGMQDISGPVGIVSTMTEVGDRAPTVAAALEELMYFAALLAVNLAVMNLLPIPALDGGRILFLLLDAICLLLFRRKIPERYQIAVNGACFAALMIFMIMVTFQDVFRLFR